MISWDTRKGAIKESIVTEMFESFTETIRILGIKHSEEWKNPLEIIVPSASKKKVICERNKGITNQSRIQQRFVKYAKKNSNKTAVIDAVETVTYGELLERAEYIAGYLRKEFVENRTGLVAIRMKKSVNQIAAVMGVLIAGFSYLPIDIKQPLARQEKILSKANVIVELDEKKVNMILQNLEYRLEKHPEFQNPIAYVIFTSGSTGEPNGKIDRKGLAESIQKNIKVSAIHVLYDGIDILGCALGGLSTWKLGNVAESYTTSMAGGGNRVISGIIGMVPVTFIVNTNVDRNDIDHPLHLYHRIELTFSTGRLCLVNTHGPVIWLPFLHMPRDEYGTLSINVEEEVNIPSGVTIGNVMLPSVKETFEQIWPDAVKKALEILFKQNRTEKMSMAQYQIYVSKLWSEICQKVGYMNIVDYDNFGDIKNIFYDLEKRHLIKKENDGIE